MFAAQLCKVILLDPFERFARGVSLLCYPADGHHYSILQKSSLIFSQIESFLGTISLPSLCLPALLTAKISDFVEYVSFNRN